MVDSMMETRKERAQKAVDWLNRKKTAVPGSPADWAILGFVIAVGIVSAILYFVLG